MSRLTASFHGEAYCGDKQPCRDDDCYDCPQFHDMLAKLAHYEDLEEQGRLVVLPEGYTIEDLAECAASGTCPSELGLPTPLHCNHHTCYACWEAALKGNKND